MSQLTIDQLFYLAARKCRMVAVEGTTLGPDQTEECRLVYNSMVDEFKLDGGTVSHVAREVFDLIPGKGDYTVGPNGDIDPTSPVLTSSPPVDPTTSPQSRRHACGRFRSSAPASSSAPSQPRPGRRNIRCFP